MEETSKVIDWLLSKDLSTIMNIVLILSVFSLFKFIYSNLFSNKEKKFEFNKTSLKIHIDAQLNLQLYKNGDITKIELLKVLFSLKEYCDDEYLKLPDEFSSKDNSDGVRIAKIEQYITKKIKELKNEQLYCSVKDKLSGLESGIKYNMKKSNLDILASSLIFTVIIFFSLIVILFILMYSYTLPESSRAMYQIIVVLGFAAMVTFWLALDQILSVNKLKTVFVLIIGNIIIISSIFILKFFGKIAYSITSIPCLLISIIFSIFMVFRAFRKTDSRSTTVEN